MADTVGPQFDHFYISTVTSVAGPQFDHVVLAYDPAPPDQTAIVDNWDICSITKRTLRVLSRVLWRDYPYGRNPG